MMTIEKKNQKKFLHPVHNLKNSETPHFWTHNLKYLKILTSEADYYSGFGFYVKNGSGNDP